MLRNHLHSLGKQSALPLSYHQELSAPNTVPAVPISGRNQLTDLQIPVLHIADPYEDSSEAQYSKLQRLVRPRELTHVRQRHQGTHHHGTVSEESCRLFRSWLPQQGWSGFWQSHKCYLQRIHLLREAGVLQEDYFPIRQCFRALKPL